MMPAVIPQIGSIMRIARESMSMSQSDLAKKTETSKQTIVAIENNQRFPSFEVLCRLVYALDISADLIVHPHRAIRTLGQEQFIRKFLACDLKEQRIISAVFNSLLLALRHDEPEQQG